MRIKKKEKLAASKESNKNKVLLLFLCGIILVIALVLSFLNQGKNQDGKEESVLKIAEGNQLVKEFILEQGFSSKVTEIKAERIAALALTDKVYEGLPEKTIYRIDYSSREKGNFVVLVDLEEGKVLNFFRVASISMGS